MENVSKSIKSPHLAIWNWPTPACFVTFKQGLNVQKPAVIWQNNLLLYIELSQKSLMLVWMLHQTPGYLQRSEMISHHVSSTVPKEFHEYSPMTV
jgi:hypothetical protein